MTWSCSGRFGMTRLGYSWSKSDPRGSDAGRGIAFVVASPASCPASGFGFGEAAERASCHSRICCFGTCTRSKWRLIWIRFERALRQRRRWLLEVVGRWALWTSRVMGLAELVVGGRALGLVCPKAKHIVRENHSECHLVIIKCCWWRWAV